MSSDFSLNNRYCIVLVLYVLVPEASSSSSVSSICAHLQDTAEYFGAQQYLVCAFDNKLRRVTQHFTVTGLLSTLSHRDRDRDRASKIGPLSVSTSELEKLEDTSGLIGEDAAVFSFADQSLNSWAAFLAVLGTVLAALYYFWINPETGYGEKEVDFTQGRILI